MSELACADCNSPIPDGEILCVACESGLSAKDNTPSKKSGAASLRNAKILLGLSVFIGAMSPVLASIVCVIAVFRSSSGEENGAPGARRWAIIGALVTVAWLAIAAMMR